MPVVGHVQLECFQKAIEISHYHIVSLEELDRREVFGVGLCNEISSQMVYVHVPDAYHLPILMDSVY